MKKLILSFSMVLSFNLTAAAAPSPWDLSRNLCEGLSSSSFQERIKTFRAKVKEGKSWEVDIALEKKELEKMITHTCPAYLNNPNGNVRAFIAEYGKLAQRALNTKQTSDGIVDFIDDETKEATEYFREEGVVFSSFPCAKGLGVLKAKITKEEAFIEKQFLALQTKCPAVAQANVDEAVRNMKVTAPTGEGAPKRAQEIGGRPKPKRESTITGDIDGQPTPPKK